ncbi:MAG: hypothetical protein ACKN9E_11090 [Microcystaceae cyanobacterium]
MTLHPDRWAIADGFYRAIAFLIPDGSSIRGINLLSVTQLLQENLR